MVVALGEDRGRGTRRSYQVFDPLQLAVRAAAIRVRAESTWAVVDSAAFDGATSRWAGVHADSLVAWHVVEEAPGGIDAWVDELGQLVERAMPSGERARRTAYEVAFENWRSRDRHPTPTATATREAAFPPRDSLRVVATGLPLDRLQVAHRWQHRAGDTLVAAAPVLPRTGDYALPIPRAVRERFVRELQVEPMIEVEAPAIMGLARRLRAREPHPPTVARRLAEWVADSVADDDTPTPPSAQATARSRAGGQAHRVHLYIALARAAGIPSRAVHGVRLSDRGFVQRIWAESWLGGEWFPVDPLSKRWMTDASYIRLLVGGATLDAEVARLLEHAPLTVLSAGGSSRR